MGENRGVTLFAMQDVYIKNATISVNLTLMYSIQLPAQNRQGS